MSMISDMMVEDAEQAMSPALFDKEWCPPVKIGDVWCSGPKSDPVGHVMATTLDGAEWARGRVRDSVERVARGVVWG